MVIGVGGSLSKGLAGAADSVLRYEREVVALVDDASEPDIVISWIETILRDWSEKHGDESMLLSQLGSRLSAQYGFDAQAQLGCPLKEIVLRAELAGRLQIRTEGTVNFVSLAESVLSSPSAEHTSENGTTTEVDLLTASEQSALLDFLHDLEQRSRYLTFSYLVNNVVAEAVVPRLDRPQVERIVNQLLERGVLLREETQGILSDAPEAMVTLLRLNMNVEVPLIQPILARQEPEMELLIADD